MPGISLNIIRVGSEQFTAADESTIRSAIETLRGTYATIGLTLRRVEDHFITTAQAEGHDVIDSDGEAEDLTDEWTIPNNAVDVFFVKLYVGGVAGLSPMDGPCDKGSKGMTGTVVELSGSTTGQVLAHEVAHYLGLSHVTGDSTNLMFPSVPNGGTLTTAQGNTMRSHCFVEP
jgi:Metallo-peptidase family M12B Reprolysin-like